MNKKLILPLCAVVLVVVAALVILLVPKENGNSLTLRRNADGNYVISAGGLSSDRVSFYKVQDSAIELLARRADDGTASVALGTCQSCNGSPKAYYTQQGNLLQCNNCGLTFPLSVIDAPGGGCHPMMIDSSVLTHDGNDAVINAEGLAACESLFAKVEAH